MGAYFDINRAMFYARQRFFNHIFFIQMQIKLVAVGFATPALSASQILDYLNSLSPEQRAAALNGLYFYAALIIDKDRCALLGTRESTRCDANEYLFYISVENLENWKMIDSEMTVYRRLASLLDILFWRFPCGPCGESGKIQIEIE
ncbi:hypothetical protein BCV71DRAFT_237989 [Rhizopus microsporus]|uniref:Uncharacterized protein n=1 Tax=Rhizopus microsporus TaxID=58291 RepID=A0A1X0RSD1_RHIZD|nr:hypothetical protein BCV71DRAFT_237989 [Rhizopus microsporus]